jgi:hypothetical protein
LKLITEIIHQTIIQITDNRIGVGLQRIANQPTPFKIDVERCENIA